MEPEPAEPHVTLYSSGLLSKWGFDDGDPPESFLDYCDERGIQSPPWPLESIIRKYMLPVLDQAVEIIVIGITIHNPVRAVTVDGVNVEDEWYDAADRTQLTPEVVRVPLREIFAMIS